MDNKQLLDYIQQLVNVRSQLEFQVLQLTEKVKELEQAKAEHNSADQVPSGS